MQSQLNFPILAGGVLSDAVLAEGFSTFIQLAERVRLLPYGRTAPIADPLVVLREKRGTCSSKHQLLAAVAHECAHLEVQLTVGIFEMREQNTPGVGAVLSAASLSCIPEAHCYLMVGGDRFDFTGLSPGASSPFDALLSEHVVSPDELSQSKVRLHMQAIASWAAAVGLSPESAWATREACIKALATNAASTETINFGKL